MLSDTRYGGCNKFDKMNSYAREKRKENDNENRKKYSLLFNNCGDFATKILNQDENILWKTYGKL